MSLLILYYKQNFIVIILNIIIEFYKVKVEQLKIIKDIKGIIACRL